MVILPHMRLTGEALHGQMKHVPSLRYAASRAPPSETAPTLQERLSGFTENQFSRNGRSENKMRGTRNESAAMYFLRQQY